MVNNELKLCHYSPYYPQANEQADSSNKLFLNLLKGKLKSIKGKWVKELYGVLRTIKTSQKNVTNENPFSLIYWTEVMILT